MRELRWTRSICRRTCFLCCFLGDEAAWSHKRGASWPGNAGPTSGVGYAGRAAGMSLAELRGYARAQAAGLVAAEADRVLGHRHVRPPVRERVLAAGVDQVVNMAVRDVLCGLPVAAARPIAA